MTAICVEIDQEAESTVAACQAHYHLENEPLLLAVSVDPSRKNSSGAASRTDEYAKVVQGEQFPGQTKKHTVNLLSKSAEIQAQIGSLTSEILEVEIFAGSSPYCESPPLFPVSGPRPALHSRLRCSLYQHLWPA